MHSYELALTPLTQKRQDSWHASATLDNLDPRDRFHPRFPRLRSVHPQACGLRSWSCHLIDDYDESITRANRACPATVATLYFYTYISLQVINSRLLEDRIVFRFEGPTFPFQVAYGELKRTVIVVLPYLLRLFIDN